MPADGGLPKENFRDWLNEFRQDLKFRYVPFRGYYRLRAYKYMLWKDPDMGLLRHLTDARKDSLDIGANLGLFTYFLARYSRHVYAFEPNPYPLRSLRSVVDDNVTVLPMAVSDYTGEAELVVPKSIKGWSSNGAFLDRETEGPAARLTVPCTTIDDLDYRGIGFIKIDIEGHEKAALLGARRTLARERPNLFIENEVAHAGAGVDEVFALLRDMDYQGFALVDGVLTSLRNFSFEEHQVKRRADGDARGYVKNFIFIPD
ncbi:MAG: FkbM family methyltransferase [Proteobacteria bacterium]|nr:FkbM family methyltransferase [Pseudomonadota bacterium]